jgi:hypothetical protein
LYKEKLYIGDYTSEMYPVEICELKKIYRFSSIEIYINFTNKTIETSHGNKSFKSLLKFWEVLHSANLSKKNSSLLFNHYYMNPIISKDEIFTGFIDNTKITFGCQTGYYGQIRKIVEIVQKYCQENNIKL